MHRLLPLLQAPSWHLLPWPLWHPLLVPSRPHWEVDRTSAATHDAFLQTLLPRHYSHSTGQSGWLTVLADVQIT